MKHIGTQDIKTDRLQLRKFQLNDINSFYRNYGSDPKVHQYVNFLPCTTLEETQAFIEGLQAKYEDPSFYAWAMVHEQDVFGYVDLHNIDEASNTAHIRFSFGSEWWWNGYSTETARAIRDFAFDEIGIHRLYSTHHELNVSNGSTLIKIGMEPEGILRGGYKNADGSYSNEKLYGMVAEDRK